jgi:hypothetical protein
MVSSSFAGRLADRRSFPTVARTSITVMVAGMALRLSHTLALFAVGFGLFTAAFFAAHSVISSWLSQLAGAAPFHRRSPLRDRLLHRLQRRRQPDRRRVPGNWLDRHCHRHHALSIAALAAAATT